jgi:hypothetical protein
MRFLKVRMKRVESELKFPACIKTGPDFFTSSYVIAAGITSAECPGVLPL